MASRDFLLGTELWVWPIPVAPFLWEFQSMNVVNCNPSITASTYHKVTWGPGVPCEDDYISEYAMYFVSIYINYSSI